MELESVALARQMFGRRGGEGGAGSAAKAGISTVNNTYAVCFGEDVQCRSCAAAGDTRLRVHVFRASV